MWYMKMTNRRNSISDQYCFKYLSSNPFEILPDFFTEDLSRQLPDHFLAMEERPNTNPFGHLDSGTESCISLPQFEDHDHSIPSNMHGSFISVDRPMKGVDSVEKRYLNFQSTETLQSLVQSSSARDQNSHENNSTSQSRNIPQGKQVEFQLHESTDNNDTDWNKCCTINFEKNDKVENPSSNTINVERATSTNRNRIRWTQDLHNQFIECVHRLGGAKKATPRGILKLMKCEGLTIFHIKSHLQKYRVGQYSPNSKEDSQKVIDTCSVAELDQQMIMQMIEALRLQLDVQRRLHEQLECQRKLQLQIEEQARQLKKMFRRVENLPI